MLLYIQAYIYNIYFFIKIYTYIIINDAQGCFTPESVETSNHHNQRPNIPTGATIISRFVGVIPCYSTFFVAKSP